MAKTQTAQTLSPTAFASFREVLAEDAKAVAQQANWSYGRRAQSHFAGVVGPAGWGGGTQIGAARSSFRSTATGYVTVLAFYIQINPDTVNLVIGARCQFEVGGSGNVRVTVGAANAVLQFVESGGVPPVANNGSEGTATLATSSTGTGWQVVTVELDQTAGATTSNYLRDLRIEDQEITSSLPSPTDE